MFFKKWKKEDCAEHVWKKYKKNRNHTISWTTSFCFLDGARAYVGLQPIVLFFRKTVNTLVRKREIKKKHFKTPSWRRTFTCAKSSRFLGGSLVSFHILKIFGVEYFLRFSPTPNIFKMFGVEPQKINTGRYMKLVTERVGWGGGSDLFACTVCRFVIFFCFTLCFL